MPASEYFSIQDSSHNIEFGFDRSIVLPPDAATVQMARIGKDLLKSARIAERIYERDGGNGALDRGIDLGSGSSIIGFNLMDTIKTLISVDNDPKALEYGKQNLQTINNYLEYGVDLQFIEGSWHDAATWEALPESGLIISNPPYLVKGELVRPGYEQTPEGHLYVDSIEELVGTYDKILSESLMKLPMWGSVVIRLPRNNSEVTSWPQLLVKNSLEVFKSFDDSSFMVRSVHEDREGERPLHFLYAQRVPIEYDFLETSADPNIINVQQGRRRPLIAVPSEKKQRLMMVSDLW